MKIEMDTDTALMKVILVEINYTNTLCTPTITQRLAITMGPLGAWTLEGDMPLDKAAKQFIDSIVQEANRQGVRLVRDFSD